MARVRAVRVWAIGVVAVAALVGCVPRFPDGASLAAAPIGSGADLAWPAGLAYDAGTTIGAYRIDVDGLEVARVSAFHRSCELRGLSPGDHEVTVTAYDTSDQWSGGSAPGRLTATVEPPEPADPGTTITCAPPVAERLAPNRKVVPPSLSDDGRFVLYPSDVAAAPGDTPNTYDLFLLDRVTGTTTQITNGDSNTGSGAISGDGRIVAFGSAATNLIPGSPTTGGHLYWWERETGTLHRVDGLAGTPSGVGSLSDDGRYAGIWLAPPGAGNRPARWDRETGALVVATDTQLAYRDRPGLSSDGRFAAYSVVSVVDGRSVQRLVRWDVESDTYEQIDLPPDTTVWDSTVMSDDGSVGAVVATDAGQQSVLLWERATGAWTDLSLAVGGKNSWLPGITDDGRYVVFNAQSTPATPSSSGFVWDRADHSLTQFNPPDRPVLQAAISGDGRSTVIISSSAPLPGSGLELYGIDGPRP